MHKYVPDRAVGFSGTRKGMDDEQVAAVRGLLSSLYHTDGYRDFHHGDCIGADAQAHEIAQAIGYRIILHPPDDGKNRAWCHMKKKKDITLDPKPYLDRDRDIVWCADVFIAGSLYQREVRRSGTWTSVRLARTRGKLIYVVYPEGRIGVDGNDA